MTDKLMTPDEAMKVICKWATFAMNEETMLAGQECEDALAVLSGLHAHWSKFKVGDEVWVGIYDQGELQCVDKTFARTVSFTEDAVIYNHVLHQNICFPTEAEARAECERRNGK